MIVHINSVIRNQESEVRSRRDVACYVSTEVRSQESEQTAL
ncbi:hypothetical protein [Mastigocoleus testarum]|nr:hypothetical protein [Mastigocoleus testarum]